MRDRHAFKGYQPGDASGGILPAFMADLPLDFGTLEKSRTRLSFSRTTTI
jgi:formate dehydrogenase beta subunit